MNISFITYQTEKLRPQRIMVKTTSKSDLPWSAISSVIVCWSRHSVNKGVILSDKAYLTCYQCTGGYYRILKVKCSYPLQIGRSTHIQYRATYYQVMWTENGRALIQLRLFGAGLGLVLTTIRLQSCATKYCIRIVDTLQGVPKSVPCVNKNNSGNIYSGGKKIGIFGNLRHVLIF